MRCSRMSWLKLFVSDCVIDSRKVAGEKLAPILLNCYTELGAKSDKKMSDSYVEFVYYSHGSAC